MANITRNNNGYLQGTTLTAIGASLLPTPATNMTTDEEETNCDIAWILMVLLMFGRQRGN